MNHMQMDINMDIDMVLEANMHHDIRANAILSLNSAANDVFLKE